MSIDKPSNPYIAGPAIAEDRDFFDRVEIMEWVNHELEFGTRVLVIKGQRRIGKTSLLLRLQRLLSRKVFYSVYFSLEDQAGKPVKSVLVGLAEEMVDGLTSSTMKNKRSVLPKTDDNERIFRRDFLPKFLKEVSPLRLVILLDEFDVFTDVSITNKLLKYFSKLTNDIPELAFVIATGRDPADLSKEYSTIFKGAHTNEIWVLDPTNAIALVRQAEDNNTLKFSQEAINRILVLTHFHPFLTQLLCYELWQRAYFGVGSKHDEIPLIKVDDVDAVVENALRTGELQLAWFWDGLTDPEKVYIAALAEISEEGKSMFEDEVIEILSKYAERFRTYRLDLAPKDLVKRNILEETKEREYRFVVEIIRRWVRKNRSLKTVTDELDRRNEPAERLFLLGQSFSDRQNLDEAKTSFERALKEKPDHLRALLGLGEILVKLEKFDEAVQILDKANKLDELGRVPLARALVYYAQTLFNAGEEEPALEASEKALRLSPNERGAKSIKAAIWNRRGDAALEHNDMSFALDAYQNAGNHEGIQKVYVRQQEEKEKLLITSKIKPELLFEIVDPKHSQYTLAFSPDNVYLASGNENGDIIIRGPATGKQIHLLMGHSAKVNSVSYSPNGLYLASGSDDKSIIIWEYQISKKLKVLQGHNEAVQNVVYAANGAVLASGSKDKKVILWDAITGNMLQTLDGHSGTVSCVDFSRDGRMLASGAYDHTIVIWDTATYQKMHTLTGHSDKVNSVIFSPDGLMLASGSDDNEIILWEVATWKKVRTLGGHTEGVSSLTFSPDSIILASGSRDNQIILWYVTTGQQITSLDTHYDVLSTAFSNSGILLASSSDEGHLQIWRIRSPLIFNVKID